MLAMEANKPTQAEINEREWADTSNWTFGVYNAPRDTRVWVPKPVRWTGWTVNFAHRMAYVWLFVLLGVPSIVVITVIYVTRLG